MFRNPNTQLTKLTSPSSSPKKTRKGRKKKREISFQALESRQLLNSDPTWLITGGDANDQSITASAIDDDGSVYVAINFEGTLDIAPNQTFPDDRDILVGATGETSDALAKYDSSGNLLWVNRFENLPSYHDGPSSMFVSQINVEAGGVYLSGSIKGAVDLSPNASAESTIESTYEIEYFGARYVARFAGNDGDYSWSYATDADDLILSSLDVDNQGTAYFAISGAYNDVLMTFGGQEIPGSLDFYSTTYIQTIDATGQLRNTQRLGSQRFFTVYDLVINDASLNPSEWQLYAVGTNSGEVYLGDADSLGDETTIGESNPAYSDGTLEDFHERDILVFSLENDGKLDWAHTYDASGTQEARGLVQAGDESLYISGVSRTSSADGGYSDVTFDASSPNGTLGPGDYLLHLNQDGSFVAAATTSANLLGTTSNGVLVEARANEPTAAGGMLLTPTTDGKRYILELSSDLHSGSALLVHGADLADLQYDGVTITTAGSFQDGETLPDGTTPNGKGEDDLYITRFIPGPTLDLPAAESVILFEDDFESGSNSNDWVGNWVEDSQNDWFRSQQRSAGVGSYSAEVDGRASNATLTMANPVDLSDLSAAKLYFDWYLESGFDTGEYVAVDGWNGSEWVELRIMKGNETTENEWRYSNVKLDPTLLVEDFKVRFRCKVSAWHEDANIDNVRITGVKPLASEIQNQLPIANAGGPYVMHEGDLIHLNASISTDPDGSVVSYQWDFDADGEFDDASGANPTFRSRQSGTHAVSVEVVDNQGGASVDTTQVTVLNQTPTAHAGGPYTAQVGDTITLSAAFSNDPGDDITSYEWDLDNDGLYDDVTGITTEFSSANAGSFTVSVRVSDENGATGTSSAIVTVSEPTSTPLDDTALVAHWTLDNTTVDSAPYGAVADNGSLTGNASFVTDSTRGQVVELDGSGDRLDVADSVDLNKTMVRQRTISFWFLADEVNPRQVLFEEGGGTRGLSIYLDGGQLYVGGWNKPSGQSGWSGTFLSTEVTVGVWHNVVLTLDGSTSVQPDTIKGYVDGNLFGSGDGSQLWGHSGDVGIGMMDDSTVFHDGNAGGDNYGFAGRLDDVRIYDRVFESNEIENLWLNY